MEKLKARIILKTLALAGILSIFFLAGQRNLLALGVGIGALSGIVNLRLLAKDVLGGASISLKKVKLYFFLKYLARYAIMGATLFLCAKVGLTLFLGAAGGFMLVYVAIFLGTFVCRPRN